MTENPKRPRQLTGKQVAAIFVAVIVLLVLIAFLNGNWSLVIDA